MRSVDNVEAVVGGGDRGPDDARFRERVRRRPGEDARQGHPYLQCTELLMSRFKQILVFWS